MTHSVVVRVLIGHTLVIPLRTGPNKPKDKCESIMIYFWKHRFCCNHESFYYLQPPQSAYHDFDQRKGPKEPRLRWDSVNVMISPSQAESFSRVLMSLLINITSSWSPFYLFFFFLTLSQSVLSSISFHTLRPTLRIDLNPFLQQSLGSLASNYNPGYSLDIRPWTEHSSVYSDFLGQDTSHVFGLCSLCPSLGFKSRKGRLQRPLPLNKVTT